MGVISGLIVTRAGQSMRMGAMSGVPVVFTRAAVGAGVWESDEDMRDATELRDERQEAFMLESEREADSMTIGLIVDNADLAEGYALSEIGLFVKTPQGVEALFAVATLRDFPDYFPTPEVAGTPSVEYKYHLTFTVEDGAQVSFASPTVREAIAAVQNAAETLRQVEEVAATFESYGHDAEGIVYSNPDWPDVSNAKEALDAALDKASQGGLEGGASTAAEVSVNHIAGLAAQNAQAALEEVFALATKGVSEIIERATGYGEGSTLQEQAAHIDAAKQRVAANLEAKGVDADPSGPLMDLVDKIPDIGFELDDISPVSQEYAEYTQNISRGDLLALKQSVSFSALSDFGGLPSNAVYRMAVSKDRSTVAFVNANTPRFVVYRRNKHGFYDVFAIPDPQPSTSGMGAIDGDCGCAVSADGTYLALTLAATPFLLIWKLTDGKYMFIGSGNVLLGSAGTRADFTDDGGMLAVCHKSSPFISVYRNVNDIFLRLSDPTLLPNAIGYMPRFSPDGKFLAVAHNSQGAKIYRPDPENYSIPISIQPPEFAGGNGHSCAWHPSGKYVIFGTGASPFINVYEFDPVAGTAKRLANPALLPGAWPQDIEFADSGDVYVAGNCVYAFSAGGISTRFPALLTHTPTAIMWHEGDKRITVTTGASPFRADISVNLAAQTFVEEKAVALGPFVALVSGDLLILGHNAAPWIQIFDIQQDGSLKERALNFTPVAGHPYQIDMKADGETLAIGVNVTPFIYTVNIRTGAVLTPTAIPARAVSSCAWSKSHPNLLLAGLLKNGTTNNEMVTVFEHTGISLDRRAAALTMASAYDTTQLCWHPRLPLFYILLDGYRVYTARLTPESWAVSGAVDASGDIKPSGMCMMNNEHLAVGGTGALYLFLLRDDGGVVLKSQITTEAKVVSTSGIVYQPFSLNDGNYIIAPVQNNPFFVEAEIENSKFVQRVTMYNLLPAVQTWYHRWGYDEKRGVLYVPMQQGSNLYRFKLELDTKATRSSGNLSIIANVDGVKRLGIAMFDGAAGERKRVLSLAEVTQREDDA